MSAYDSCQLFRHCLHVLPLMVVFITKMEKANDMTPTDQSINSHIRNPTKRLYSGCILFETCPGILTYSPIRFPSMVITHMPNNVIKPHRISIHRRLYLPDEACLWAN